MTENNLKTLLASSYISGGSAAYIEALYEDYIQDPNSIDADWRSYFDSLAQKDTRQINEVSHAAIREQFRHRAQQSHVAVSHAHMSGDAEHERKRSRVMQLINAYRAHGHHRAQLDPLAMHDRERIADLELGHHGLNHDDLEKNFGITAFPGVEHENLKDLIHALNTTYCEKLGVEYLHITNPNETHWIQQCLEPIRSKPKYSAEEKRDIFKLLTAGEGLEKYLGSRYVGQKRFGLDGSESLIPMLNNLVQRSGIAGLKEVVLGMAHRGRLNVLMNILGKAPALLFAEFEGKHSFEKLSGDVKYHMGFSSDIDTPGGTVHLALAFNPSHLEIINPVAEGSVKARQDRRSDLRKDQVLPILIHGDAAFAGQGVVMETLNFSQVRGFNTGGTVHIVINNQIGFTTSNPLDSRSTLYCTDVAKMVQAPIFHVNADDPEAVILVTQITKLNSLYKII